MSRKLVYQHLVDVTIAGSKYSSKNSNTLFQSREPSSRR